MTDTLTARLENDPIYRAFTEHPFFSAVSSGAYRGSHADAELFLGQWWHPLHYFPTFLARCVSVLPGIAAKSAVTRILNQEAGNGNVRRAHETIYADSMERAGFSRDAVVGTAPFAESAELVEYYRTSSEDHLSALGAVFATEVTDLLMVSTIGTAVATATGVEDNAWVRIHVAQEPDHVEEAGHAMVDGLTADDEDAVLEGARGMWTHWTRFFDRLCSETGIPLDAPVPAAAGSGRG